MAKNTLTTAFYQTEKNLKHPIPVRAYKDRIFRMIFKEKRALLALYNAMNDTAYQDPEELVITTLENAIYLGMKNDVSFMICDRLFLYEHQSTKNPNMPLHNLLYVADLYSVLTKDMFLYGELPAAIPEPRFVVFYCDYYNGALLIYPQTIHEGDAEDPATYKMHFGDRKSTRLNSSHSH